MMNCYLYPIKPPDDVNCYFDYRDFFVHNILVKFIKDTVHFQNYLGSFSLYQPSIVITQKIGFYCKTLHYLFNLSVSRCPSPPWNATVESLLCTRYCCSTSSNSRQIHSASRKTKRLLQDKTSSWSSAHLPL